MFFEFYSEYAFGRLGDITLSFIILQYSRKYSFIFYIIKYFGCFYTSKHEKKIQNKFSC